MPSTVIHEREDSNMLSGISLLSDLLTLVKEQCKQTYVIRSPSYVIDCNDKAMEKHIYDAIRSPGINLISGGMECLQFLCH